ncbi:MAG: hypothetical protein WCB99_09805 [Candidatus Cybelea sp.]|jgi:hypothetical protein
MKRLVVLLIFLLAASGAPPARAQVPPPPTPMPDPRTYTDAAMTFTAPANAYLLARQVVPVEQLSQDLQPVAAWAVHPGAEDARMIQISMEAYDGAPDQWEGQFESQTHGSQDGTLIRNKTPMTLLNGMPAYFVEVASGSGFDARKEFAIVWADGQRGVVLSETSRMGDVSAEEAKEALKQVTAVRYPVDQP